MYEEIKSQQIKHSKDIAIVNITGEGVHRFHRSLKGGRNLNGFRTTVLERVFHKSSNNHESVYREENHVTPQGLKVDILLLDLTERPRASKKSEKC